MTKNSVIIEDFEAENEPIIDQDNNHGEKIDICKQLPVCNGFYVINKLNELPIQAGYHKSPFGQNINKWFLNKTNIIEYQIRLFLN